MCAMSGDVFAPRLPALALFAIDDTDVIETAKLEIAEAVAVLHWKRKS